MPDYLEWRDVVTAPDYQVSKCGKVRSLDRIVDFRHGRTAPRRGRPMKLRANARGYLTVCLCVCGQTRKFFVHRLVAEAFICPRPKGLFVNHKDGNKENNHFSNLEWVTAAANAQHAHKNGLNIVPSKLTDSQKRLALSLRRRGDKCEEIAERMGVSRATISRWTQRLKKPQETLTVRHKEHPHDA